MDSAQLIKLTISASVLLLVFALGLRATFADATSFFRHLFRPPRALLRALFAMNIVVPFIAAAIAALTNVAPAVKIALLAIAVSPVPPILPGKQLKLGGRSGYVFGLLVAVSLAAIVMVPLSIELMGWLFHRDVRISLVEVAKPIGITILLPVLAGLVVRYFLPTVAERVAPWVSRFGNLLLVAGVLPVLVAAWPAIVSLIGNGTLLAIAAVVVAAVAAGHWLGGPEAPDRTALAIASAMRHPGIALAIAHINFPDNKLVPAAILLFLLVAAIVTTLYGKLRGRAHQENEGEEVQRGTHEHPSGRSVVKGDR
jgi:BASS family bile acid:Na+ symporter